MASALLLFDIDGTLVDTQGQGVDAFLSGIREIWNLDDDLSWITFAGATDLDILDRIAKRCGITTDQDSVAAFFENYASRLRTAIDPKRVRVLPAVREVLDQLAARPEISLGLVTGNARETAYLKLAAADLDHYFPDGGFGDEHPIRAELVGLAMNRLKRAGEGEMGCALIGDTPNDLLAAVTAGVLPIGVSTGRYTMQELDDVHQHSEIIEDFSGLIDCLKHHYLVK